jgi:hypothetical protein
MLLVHDISHHQMENEPPVSLVDLPDLCLLAVLRCLADDPVSLLSAARAHRRLHQAAAVALSSITVTLKQQQQLDSVLLYLEQHDKHVGSVQLTAMPLSRNITLRQLPPNLQLTSLQFDDMHLQLQRGDGFQGVLRPGLPLKQLRLQRCKLLDGAEGVAAAWQALSLLSGLDYLSISCWAIAGDISFPTAVLSKLQQLTYLELRQIARGSFLRADESVRTLQSLQALTRLVALSTRCAGPYCITASMLSQSCQLTRLELATPDVLEPAALAGKTRLKHLVVNVRGDSGHVAGLVSQLQHLT